MHTWVLHNKLPVKQGIFLLWPYVRLVFKSNVDLVHLWLCSCTSCCAWLSQMECHYISVVMHFVFAGYLRETHP